MTSLILWLMLRLIAGQVGQNQLPGESIRGTVIRADTRTPLSRVRVELAREDFAPRANRFDKVCKPQPDIATSTLRRFAMTDDSGGFTFGNIPAGRYVLSAEHEGFVRAEYGQRGRFPIGTVLPIGPQEGFVALSVGPQSPGTPTPPVVTTVSGLPQTVLQNLSISMYPAPLISGRILDDKGATVAAAVVQAYQLRYTPLNGRTLKSIRSVLTDDRGDYRLFWLNPGEYFLTAGYSDYGIQPWKQGLRLTPNLPDADSGYPMVFYPDAPAASRGIPVLVSSGSDATADIRLRARPRFNVRVQLVANPMPPDATLVFVPQGGDLCAALDYGIQNNRDGTFEVRDVPEGLYMTMAMQGPDVISELLPVKVDRGDVDNVRLALVPPTAIPGTIDFGNAPEGLDLGGVRVNLTRTGMEVHHVTTGQMDPNTRQFLIRGVGPGSYYATVDLPAGAYVQSIVAMTPPDIPCGPLPTSGKYRYLDNHYHLDPTRPLQIPNVIPTEVACLRIQVVFGGRFKGRVLSRTREPVAGALVVAIPRSFWTNSGDGGLAAPDHFLTGTTDSQGRYVINGVFPGEPVNPMRYRLYAFEDLDPNMIYDPAFPDRFPNRESFTRRYQDNLGRLRESIGTTAVVVDASSAFSPATCSQGIDECILTLIPAEDTVRGTR